MPLTEKGQEIMANMKKQYGEEKGERVFYASKNKGNISGVDQGLMGPELAESAAGLLGRQAAGEMISHYAKPFSTSATPTATQSQENIAMGRPPEAGPFGQMPKLDAKFEAIEEAVKEHGGARDPEAVAATVRAKQLGGFKAMAKHREEVSDNDAWSPEAREAAAEARRAKAQAGSSTHDPQGRSMGEGHDPRYMGGNAEAHAHLEKQGYTPHPDKPGWVRHETQGSMMPSGVRWELHRAGIAHNAPKGAWMGDQPAIPPPSGGALPTPTPTQAPTPPSVEKPKGILPASQPAPTNPVSVNAYKEMPTGRVSLESDGPRNRLVAGDQGRVVGKLADYARAAGKR
jgi:hypothetical protein